MQQLAALLHELGIVQAVSEMIETQLAETTEQLQQLKLRQKQLEARNNLLEKVAVLNKQQSLESKDALPLYQVLSSRLHKSATYQLPSGIQVAFAGFKFLHDMH